MMQPTADLSQLLNNLLRFGTVMQVRPAPPRVRVRMGDLESAWLPWFNTRAGHVKTSFQPSIGEQALVLSPGGNMSAGCVLLGLNSDSAPPPDCGPNDYVIDMPADGKLVLRCGNTSLTLSADNFKALATRIDLN